MEPLKRILIVEDEPEMQNILRLTLMTGGNFTLKTCSTGSQAVSAVRLFPPDLVLLDEAMPGFDGLDTLRVLRSIPQTASVPIIFVTGKCRPQDIEEYMARGATGVITKPFDPFNFIKAVEEICSRVIHA